MNCLCLRHLVCRSLSYRLSYERLQKTLRNAVSWHATLGTSPSLFPSPLFGQANITLLSPYNSHVGDGNVHSLALFRDEAELHRVEVAVHEMVERAIRLGGTCSGEHGVGLGKIDYLPLELGNGTVNLMETIKRTGELTISLLVFPLLYLAMSPFAMKMKCFCADRLVPTP